MPVYFRLLGPWFRLVVMFYLARRHLTSPILVSELPPALLTFPFPYLRSICSFTVRPRSAGSINDNLELSRVPLDTAHDRRQLGRQDVVMTPQTNPLARVVNNAMRGFLRTRYTAVFQNITSLVVKTTLLTQRQTLLTQRLANMIER